MRAKKKFYVVAYDVTDNRNRDKLSKLLAPYGVRVNLSVFECMFTPRQLATVQERALRLIDLRTDRILFYPLCLDCYAGILRLPDRRQPPEVVSLV